MGSAVKKVTTLPRKIIKTVKKNPALLALAAPIAFPTAFAGVTAASSSAFLKGAAKRALIQALATKATGGDVSIKDSLIGGAVGQGIGQFGGNAAMFKDVNKKLLQAGIGAATNVGTSLARGQKIDPRSALISGGLNYLTTPGARVVPGQEGFDSTDYLDTDYDPNTYAGAGDDLYDVNTEAFDLPSTQATNIMPQPKPEFLGQELTQTPTVATAYGPGYRPATQTGTNQLQLGQAQAAKFPMTSDFSFEEAAKLDDALRLEQGIPTTASQIPGVSYTDNKTDFLQTGSYKQIAKDLFQGNIADAAKLTYRIATDNPFETITALSAAAPLFFSPVPQEGETEEDFAQRRVDVTNYLRQYGSNFYSGKDLDDFISRTTSNLGYAQGGRVEAMGGGIMGLGKIPMGTPRMNQGGVTELDYRAEGGFVPVGIKEKADDVPAMLSKNEFVMTADAVRSAGDGSIEKGAQKMYDTMKQLESRVV